MKRADVLIYERGLSPSRQKARALIEEGKVTLTESGKPVAKPSQLLEEETALTVTDEPRYVSRGGDKLEKALNVFGVSPEGKVCLDCGASTGGFTDCLLQHGAQLVYALDVGHDQLAEKLRHDERVISKEHVNVRFLSEAEVPEKVGLAVADLSFISLTLVMEPIASRVIPGGEMIFLVKPQFEAGREGLSSKGVVKDPKVHKRVLKAVVTAAGALGLETEGLCKSPIKGQEGNTEFLIYLKNTEEGESRPTSLTAFSDKAERMITAAVSES